jgi:hypothetical protein
MLSSVEYGIEPAAGAGEAFGPFTTIVGVEL